MITSGSKNTILITGGSGNLGKEMVKLLPEALAPNSKELDIRNKKQVELYIKKHRPQTIYHLAAKTGIPPCEEDPGDAWANNVLGTENLVVALQKYVPGARFVYISTACVFDGERGNYTEEDFPSPKNYYALTKLVGEFAASRLPNYLVIRTNFVAREPWPHPKAFTDRYGTYLFADDLANAIIKTAERKLTGTVHVCGDRKLSMYQLAKITTPDIQPMTMTETKYPLTRDMTLRSVKIKPFRLTRINKEHSRPYKAIDRCRVCGNSNLISIINLGNHALTGVFPRSKNTKLTTGPLELVKCHGKTGKDKVCNLVQLKHSYNLAEMYGENYGYRSGLNQSMVKHLESIASYAKSKVKLAPGEFVIDIGSNDSTLLQFYPKNAKLVGIDPTGKKFRKFYPPHIQLIPDFFGAEAVKKQFPSLRAKIITSIAMFYDLESPLNFAKEIAEVLDGQGVWIFEQSYLPLMLEKNAYDTICQEHLEYYSLSQVIWIANRAGLKVIDVETNLTNGGSFRVTVAKVESKLKVNEAKIKQLLKAESKLELATLRPYLVFKTKIASHAKGLRDLIKKINQSGETVAGYGASTKGNVILQYLKLSNRDIPYIAEINEDKFGCVTPGTGIRIIAESQARAKKPDYLLVLPWHFRDNIVAREKEYLAGGGKLIFPLPKIEIVTK